MTASTGTSPHQETLFNFLVTAADGAWERTVYEFGSNRFLEYTTEKLARSFTPLTSKRMDLLKSLPTLFAYEGDDQPMLIGKITLIEERSTVIRIHFEIDRTIAPIPFNVVNRLRLELDIRNWELNRTHWAVKSANLMEVLSAAGAVGLSPPTLPVDLPPPDEPAESVSSVGAFTSAVLRRAHPERWEVFYRGHAAQTFRLEPSLFRRDVEGNYKHLEEEHRLYRELLISNSADFEQDTHTLDRLVRMQHYSLPTRLLDITSNPLIALFFACNDTAYENDTGEIVIFSVRPGHVRYFDSDTASCIANLARLDHEAKEAVDFSLTDIDEFNRQEQVRRLLHFIREEKTFFEPKIIPQDLKRVLCVKGKRTNTRISFQSGAFLLFGHDAALNESGTDEITVTRIAISEKAKILRELDQLNINESTVFPNIENSARYIARRYAFKPTSTAAPLDVPPEL
ncbi:FRG domain-containing protein [Luteibacter sp. 9135]|uniref:FRG domain-containing protein n=1 Tax=Luteibacter sp. 9135 TaxID=1500893 RepID=UPI001C83CDED|nr:FRG domain-containing protein [Luteibacter sp. 9135]